MLECESLSPRNLDSDDFNAYEVKYAGDDVDVIMDR